MACALVLGLALKNAPASTKVMITNFSDALSQVVRWVINLAPLGIMGLVFDVVSTNGLESFREYGQLLLVLVGCMAFMALVVNPLITFIYIRQNPYPLVFKCLRESGVTAFFTRSSAANIPVNMKLCEDLGLDKDNYSVSIPLDLPTAIILSVLAAVSEFANWRKEGKVIAFEAKKWQYNNTHNYSRFVYNDERLFFFT